MDLSLFLARAWGLAIALICLGIILNRKRFLSALSRLKPAEFILAGLLVIGVGSAQVVGYEHWGLNWEGLITLLGWGSLIKGLLLFFVPGYSSKFIKVLIKDNVYNGALVVGLIIGVYLLYVGYLMY